MTWPTAVSIVAVLATITVPLLTFIRSGRSDRQSRTDQLEAKFDRLSARYAALEDYCYSLRSDVAKTGVTPRPWPAELGGHDE